MIKKLLVLVPPALSDGERDMELEGESEGETEGETETEADEDGLLEDEPEFESEDDIEWDGESEAEGLALAEGDLDGDGIAGDSATTDSMKFWFKEPQVTCRLSVPAVPVRSGLDSNTKSLIPTLR